MATSTKSRRPNVDPFRELVTSADMVDAFEAILDQLAWEVAGRLGRSLPNEDDYRVALFKIVDPETLEQFF